MAWLGVRVDNDFGLKIDHVLEVGGNWESSVVRIIEAKLSLRDVPTR